ncbi:uncharacterized protein LOC129588974 [Paramacrobiotus metropolitanus]|uniref:uncharacterized protein LOC129588974 n=1 Tax=Paramacrobiotus metropolitanus TaxID=2943436 RepID=UPI002445E4C1|nr:uncharacterized protein LOC129588974 [Paramacrobiotus metropolitanus]
MADGDGRSTRKRFMRSCLEERVSAEDAPKEQAASSSSVLEEQRDSTAVQVLPRGRFNEDFQPTTTTFPSGFRKMVPPCDIQSFMNVAATFRPALPSNWYVAGYANLSSSRDTMMQKAGGAVCAAYEIAYGDQIAVFSAFMTSALEAKEIPIHASTYCMEIVGADPDFQRFCCNFSGVFNGIGLTLTESYLLLAAAFFDPSTTSAADKSLLGYLRVFYMDALTYMIGYHRRNPTERIAVFNKLNEAAKMFPWPWVHQISLKWYQTPDQALPPFPAPLKTLLQECLKH